MVIFSCKNYLKSLSKSGEIFVGIKRDLMGDLTGEYIWFLMPISSQKGGNFFVMEAGSTIESGGKATYLFKMPTQEDIESLAQKFNSCMLAINFRREPIYLKDEDLEKYKRGELVEPKKQIVYYIDPATPKQWRPYLIAGINDWQKAFEKAV